MKAKFTTKDGSIQRYFHDILSVDCVIKENKLFFFLSEKDGTAHYIPCLRYSLICLESEETYGMANN